MQLAIPRRVREDIDKSEAERVAAIGHLVPFSIAALVIGAILIVPDAHDSLDLIAKSAECD